MQIQIESSRCGEPNEWRTVAEQRVRFVLRRLKGEVQQARVSVRDINGHRGGVDKECQITLQTDGHGTVVVVSRSAKAGQALNDALQRATQALVRTWQRRRRAQRKTANPEVLSLLPVG